MRAISNALLWAQTAASGRPYVRVEALDRLAGAARLRPLRRYTGAEPAGHHAVAVTGGGALLRARLHPADGVVWVQRVADPSEAAGYGHWTRLQDASAACSIALASRGSHTLLCYRDARTPGAVWARESADDGLTWGPPQAVAALTGQAVSWLAAAHDAQGAPAVFMADDRHRILMTRRTGGAWSAPVSHSFGLAGVSGLACAYDTAWRVVIAGRNAAGGQRLWGATHADGWSPLQEITRADGGSGVRFAAPSLLLAEEPRLFAVEDARAAGGAARALQFTGLARSSFAENAWRDPMPFPVDSPYGVAAASHEGAVWFSAPGGVWEGSLAAPSRDLSADVVSLGLRDAAQGGTATVALRNDDGRYDAGLGATEGAELRISPGYQTPQGVAVSAGPAYWVTSWERSMGGGGPSVTLRAADGWSLLSAWRARRQFTWAPGEAPVASILGYVLQRVGLGVQAARPSAVMLEHRPGFTVHPGETGAVAVRRLLAMAPDVLVFRGRTALLRLPQPGDRADYAFGGYHPLVQAQMTQNAPEATRVQVFGAASVGEAFAWDQMPLVGERLRQIHDLNQDTGAKAQRHAETALARWQRERLSGRVTAPPSCGLELHDMVEVPEPGGGTVRMRVAGIELDYRPGAAVYEQRLSLAGV